MVPHNTLTWGHPLGYIRPGPYLHYHITWWCGMPRVYPDVYFKKYDVLGDDVIITDDWPGQ